MKTKVVLKKEMFAGRLGISITMDGTFIKHTNSAVSVFDELEILSNIGPIGITFENEYDGTPSFGEKK